MITQLDFLAQISQIIGLPIAIVSIAVSIWLYWKSKQRRELSCTIDPIISPIEITAGDAIKGEIEIHYKGEVVKNLFVVRVQIKNTGNVPIRMSDVVEPVIFTFGQETEILREPRIISEIPSNLDTKWNLLASAESSKLNTAYLDFKLLNPGWETSVEFLCTGKSDLPAIKAKIEGVLNINQIDYEEKRIKNRMKEFVFSTLYAVPAITILLFLLFALSGAFESMGIFPFIELILLSSISGILLMVIVGWLMILVNRIGKKRAKNR